MFSEYQASFSNLLNSNLCEEFEYNKKMITRRLIRKSQLISELSLIVPTSLTSCVNELTPKEAFQQIYLRSTEPPRIVNQTRKISVVDLFAGCGGMSLGITEAIQAFGCDAKHIFASDHEEKIADVYKKNICPEHFHQGDISHAFDGKIGQALTLNERAIRSQINEVDLLCGGPPCQGHSDLNNYTRRDDPRNSLYFSMARAAEILEPKAVVIENVPGVIRDKTGNFKATVQSLNNLGYIVNIQTLNALDYGVPQNRKRTFVFALKGNEEVKKLERTLAELRDPARRNVLWAIEDLQQVASTGTFDEPSILTSESQKRVDWLFANDKYELDDDLRPDCHRLKTHTYNSVYGRMRANQSAPTITTGFLVMGQGRFVHPLQPRTITPHEGARIQTFPDFFDFGAQSRGNFAKMIGNAVPPLLGYYVGLALLDAIFD